MFSGLVASFLYSSTSFKAPWVACLTFEARSLAAWACQPISPVFPTAASDVLDVTGALSRSCILGIVERRPRN